MTAPFMCMPRQRNLHRGTNLVETDLDRLSNSVVSLVDEGRLDEADAACEQLRTRYPEVHDWLMRKAMSAKRAAKPNSRSNTASARLPGWMHIPQTSTPDSREPFCKDIERLRGSLDGGR